MVGMVIVIVSCVLVVLAVVAGAAWWAKRSFDTAVVRVTERQVADRDAVLTAALQQVDVLNRSQMDAATRQVQAEVAARHQVIDSSLDEVRSEIRIDLERLGELVAKMGETSAQRFGQVDASLRSHAEVAARLNDSTASLREALSNPQARGQWGERMAEDVLRLAGFTEHVNYHKQTPIAAGVAGGGGGRPDFTFDLPKGHVLYMDVKFPMASYLRYLEADTDEARAQHLRAFLTRRARPGQGAGQARVRAREHQAVGRLRAAVPAQRAAHRVHPRARSGAARRRPRPARRDVLAAHAVRLPRRHPPGLRQLHGRADEQRDPRSRRRVQPAVAPLRRVDREGGPAPRRPAGRVRPSDDHPRARSSSVRCASSRRSASSGRSRSTPSSPASCPTNRPSRRRCGSSTAARSPPTGSDRAAAAQDFAPSCPSRSSTSRTGSTTRPIVDPEGTYTVGELAEVINRRIRGGEDGLWVRGEIQGWNARGPHAYFTLADDAADTPDAKAVIDVAVFAPSRNRLRPMLERHRLRLGDGIKVRIYGYLDFYAPRGQLKLVMTGIDPRFTLGDLAQQRDQVLRRLVAGGLVDANRQAAARARRRCTSASSPASARRRGTTSIRSWPRSGLGFQLSVCDVRVQGDHAVADGGRSHRLAGRPPARRHRGHPRGRRPQRAVGVRRRVDRPRHRRLAGARAHRTRSRGRPQHRRRGGVHLVQDAHRVRPGAGRDDRDVPGRGRARLRARRRRRTRRHRASRRGARRPCPPHRPAHPRRRRPCRGGPRPTACPAAHRRPAGARRRRRRWSNAAAARTACGRRRCSSPRPATSSRCTPAPAPSTPS